MPSMHSLLPKLNTDFTNLSFAPGERFAWSPSQQTVFYKDEGNVALLLHELAHGVLDHRHYARDIELVAMETAAWDKTLELAILYGVKISQETAEENLDTYREWMHSRSTCPTCEASGYQTKKDTYSCVACGASWRVNEARLCGLKRYAN